jgi:ATP-dependent RNA helicase DeaD
MNEADLAELLGPALTAALSKKGYASLTPVQEAVLDPALEGRDLRMTSQTGSGKTVAIGFLLRGIVGGAQAGKGGVARPRALVVAPTRELARQVEEELAWLYAGTAKVVSVAGGSSVRDERRALGGGPGLVVGTPGRLLDHLTRGAIDATDVGAVVLDEADRLLDLGFREDLEKILATTPESRRTHLVSATFPRDVRALADSVQKNSANVEGTRLGEANTDIEHVVYLSDPRERIDAIVNLLLSRPGEQTLIFCRTRADVARLSRELSSAGFGVSSLSGEMEQPARDRALAGFKRGDLRVLVATDVAGRGLDVQDIACVLHADPPDDPDTYTHRSGRTGRAGRKGRSGVLVAPAGLRRVSSLLFRARVNFRVEPLPTAEAIRAAADERLCEELLADDPEGFAGFDDRTWNLAKRIAKEADPARTIARMIARARRTGVAEPRQIRSFSAPPAPREHAPRDYAPRDYAPREHAPRDRAPRAPYAKPAAPADRPSRTTRAVPADRPSRTTRAVPVDRPSRTTRAAAVPADRPSRTTRAVPVDRPSRTTRAVPADRPSRATRAIPAERPSRTARPKHEPAQETRAPREHAEHRAPRAPRGQGTGEWVPFRVTWGELHGADARRLMAVACRRGNVGGKDIGAIRLGPTWSTVEVAAHLADAFAESAAKPDERNPRVQFARDTEGTPPPRTPRSPGARPPRHDAGAHKSDSWGDRPLSRRR